MADTPKKADASVTPPSSPAKPSEGKAEVASQPPANQDSKAQTDPPKATEDKPADTPPPPIQAPASPQNQPSSPPAPTLSPTQVGTPPSKADTTPSNQPSSSSLGGKKKFSFLFPGKKNKQQSETSDKPLTPIDPAQTINQLDKEIKIIPQHQEATLAKEIDVHIANIENPDYVSFKIHKRTLLIVLGLLVGLMWIVPVVKFAQNITKTKPEIEQKTTLDQPTPNPQASSSAQIRIRVKHDPSRKDIDPLVNLLKQAQYEFIEVVTDDTSQIKGVEVVTKTQGVDLNAAIVDLLTDTYPVASSSAILSEDSDFDAVILVGKTKK